jgi:dsRNA-specific ribonuclease
MSENVPAPMQPVVWTRGVAYYKTLSMQQDFMACVRDMIERTAIPEENLINMLGTPENPKMEVYEEFAKCFVPDLVDETDNYELYEMLGDSALNKATFSYISRILYPSLSKKKSAFTVGYMDSVKAYYISKKFYSSLSVELGFDEFVKKVCYNNRAINNFLSLPDKTMNDLYEDVMEAFIGCMELQIDRYVGIHRGYVFVANFVYDLLSNIKLQFHPDFFWTAARIVKEANDKMVRTPLHTFKASDDFMSRVVAVKQGYAVPQELRNVESTGDKKKDIEEVSRVILEYYRSNKMYQAYLQFVPSPEQLGIENLV